MTFAEDLKQLVECAYPSLQEDAREQLALTHYLGQLHATRANFIGAGQNNAVICMTLLQQVVDGMDQLKAKVASLTQSQLEAG